MHKTTKELIETLKKINESGNILSKQEVDIFLFCFLLIAYLEKNIQKSLYKVLLDSQKNKLKYPELIDLLLKEKTFWQKIKILRFILKKNKNWKDMEKFVKFCETINLGIRNNLFHFKLTELNYKGLDVSDIKTQNKIIKDLIVAESKLKNNT